MAYANQLKDGVRVILLADEAMGFGEERGVCVGDFDHSTGTVIVRVDEKFLEDIRDDGLRETTEEYVSLEE